MIFKRKLDSLNQTNIYQSDDNLDMIKSIQSGKVAFLSSISYKSWIQCGEYLTGPIRQPLEVLDWSFHEQLTSFLFSKNSPFTALIDLNLRRYCELRAFV